MLPLPFLLESLSLPPLLSPSSALAWSEVAVESAFSHGPHIALWRPKGAWVALGISQKPGLEADVDAMQQDGVGLVRRQSGGGAVLLYEGVLCWEAWAGFDEIEKRQHDGNGIRQTYRLLSKPVIEGLVSLGVNVGHAGICDISSNAEGNAFPRKIAGTAQLRKKNRALVHGSLLVSPDMALLGKYLKHPSDQPEYRRDRSHRDFCTSVARILEWKDGVENLMALVAEKIIEAAYYDRWLVLSAGDVSGDEEAGRRICELEQKKYCSHDWNWEKKRLL